MTEQTKKATPRDMRRTVITDRRAQRVARAERLRLAWYRYRELALRGETTALNQTQASEALGLQQETFSKWLSAKVGLGIDDIPKLARLLRTDPTWLAWGPDGDAREVADPSETPVPVGAPPRAPSLKHRKRRV